MRRTVLMGSDGDESFSNLASRIVDEVVSSRSPSDLAKRVLKQAGIDTHEGPAEPYVFNGHLRHVGKRARKISRKENTTLRIRKVKSQSRGAPPSLRRRGAPPETRIRPSLGMEDEVRRSAWRVGVRPGTGRSAGREEDFGLGSQCRAILHGEGVLQVLCPLHLRQPRVG